MSDWHEARAVAVPKGRVDRRGELETSFHILRISSNCAKNKLRSSFQAVPLFNNFRRAQGWRLCLVHVTGVQGQFRLYLENVVIRY